MVNQQLLSFVKEQIQKGISRDEISKELLGAGWTLKDIQEVFRGANILDPNPAPEEIPVPGPNLNANINSNMNTQGFSGIPRVDLSRSQDFSTRPNNFIPADNNNSSDIRFVEKKRSSGGIFWVILILIILGGGGFYLYKNDVLTKFLPQNNVEEIPAPVLAPEPEPAPVVIPVEQKIQGNLIMAEDLCLPETKSWIKIISPDGGEVFDMGEQVSINWISCNLPSEQDLVVNIQYKNNTTVGDVVFLGTKNDGSENLTIPQEFVFKQKKYQAGKFYRAFIETPGIDAQAQLHLEDYSDGLFTIQ